MLAPICSESRWPASTLQIPSRRRTFAFYAYENAVVAVAEARGIKWTKNHFEKAKLAEKLFDDGVLSTDVSDKLPELNELRKSIAYGEPGPELEALDLQSLATDLEDFLDEVEAIIEAAKGTP